MLHKQNHIICLFANRKLQNIIEPGSYEAFKWNCYKLYFGPINSVKSAKSWKLTIVGGFISLGSEKMYGNTCLALGLPTSGLYSSVPS